MKAWSRQMSITVESDVNSNSNQTKSFLSTDVWQLTLCSSSPWANCVFTLLRLVDFSTLRILSRARIVLHTWIMKNILIFHRKIWFFYIIKFYHVDYKMMCRLYLWLKSGLVWKILSKLTRKSHPFSRKQIKPTRNMDDSKNKSRLLNIQDKPEMNKSRL